MARKQQGAKHGTINGKPYMTERLGSDRVTTVGNKTKTTRASAAKEVAGMRFPEQAVVTRTTGSRVDSKRMKSSDRKAQQRKSK